jgi:hypothetical protein
LPVVELSRWLLRARFAWWTLGFDVSLEHARVVAGTSRLHADPSRLREAVPVGMARSGSSPPSCRCRRSAALVAQRAGRGRPVSARSGGIRSGWHTMRTRGTAVRVATPRLGRMPSRRASRRGPRRQLAVATPSRRDGWSVFAARSAMARDACARRNRRPGPAPGTGAGGRVVPALLPVWGHGGVLLRRVDELILSGWWGPLDELLSSIPDVWVEDLRTMSASFLERQWDRPFRIGVVPSGAAHSWGRPRLHCW